jgi:ABC-type sugar transport system ATPase subunit
MSMSPEGNEQSPAPILTIDGLSKRFAGVHALEDISFDVVAGEIHALVGENGAGKSTLIRILAGNLRSDRGSIVFKGRKVPLQNPSEARAAGIAVIYQELTVIPQLSVAENIFLGALPTNAGGFVEWNRLNSAARAVLDHLGMDIDPAKPAGGLAIGLQQMVEIAKSLAARADLLIMDEPTSSLSHRETERLWRVIAELRRAGTTIIFVSHKLDEVFRMADRVTILRDGRKVATRPLAELTAEQMVAMMVGRQLKYARPTHANLPGGEMLSVTGLARNGRFAEIDFTVRAGEIVGFAGLVGAGRTEVMRGIFGADRIDAGAVAVEGRPLPLGDPRHAIAAGLGYLPENRKDQALFLAMSVLENMSLPSSLTRHLGFLNRPAEIHRTEELVVRLHIVTSSIDKVVAQLSGGNQQKVILARWLAISPKVLIVDEPTRGVDVGAKAEIHELLRALTRQNVAVVVVSSEMHEILSLSDRIFVMRGGRIVGEFSAGEATEERIGALALGGQEQSAHNVGR